MGFLSTVPSDADDRMRAAVRTASHKDGTFPGERLRDELTGNETNVELSFLCHPSCVGNSTCRTTVIIADQRGRRSRG